MARTSRFSRLFSLRKNRINTAFGIGRRLGSMPGIKVLHAPSATAESEARVLIMPTRLFKGHVQRNKVRRQIKAIIYENSLASCGGTFIILLYAEAKQTDFTQLKSFLVRTLRKAHD